VNKRRAPRSSDRARRIPLDQYQRILILSEGTETEPQYFRKLKSEWRIPGLIIRSHRIGRGPKVVDAALTESQDFDQVWCVFDKDDLVDSEFNDAVFRCKGNVHAAWSNESFELWLLLHYQTTPPRGTPARKKYIETLQRDFVGPFEKSALPMDVFMSRIGIAMANAELLTEQRLEDFPPAKRCPDTTVPYLIKALEIERDKSLSQFSTII
jgi:hypothetical protein